MNLLNKLFHSKLLLKTLYISILTVLLTGYKSIAPHEIEFTPPIELKRGIQLPSIEIFDSMNNVDIILHRNMYYMAFRTAPTHFADSNTMIHILTSSDGIKWQVEKSISMNADKREPRFLSYKGQLFFYFFKGGDNPFEFDPQNMYVMKKEKTGWTKPQIFFKPGYVNWRARVSPYNGKAYMSVYYGKGLYGAQASPAIYLLESEDGLNWKKISEHPQVSLPGSEEPEFEFDSEGNIWGTIRLENNGGLIFKASKDNLARWNTIKLAQKYDSALLLKHKKEFYLFARWNVDGDMDKAWNFLHPEIRKWYNLARYSCYSKIILSCGRQTRNDLY